MTFQAQETITNLLDKPNRITDMDVRHFRMEVFSDGVVSVEEAEAIIALNAAVTDKCDDWSQYFVEALVDYMVLQAEPRGSVSVANCEWLVSHIVHDGIVTTLELELLVCIIEKASYVPSSLSDLALLEVAKAVLEADGEKIFGRQLVKGKLGLAEVELIRRVLYANGGESGIAISRLEAEVLFNLNDQTSESENHPAWSDLFVKAIANYLMAVSGYQGVGREEALRRDAWLEDTETDVAGVLANALRSIGQTFTKKTFKDAFTTDSKRMQKAWGVRVANVTARQQLASKIEEHEGAWLAERIGRDGAMHQNEQALISFIREENPKIHPAVDEMIKKLAS
ncbi:MAG: hypothetical protein QM488_10395 [Rhizobiaceae bacterium]